VRDRSGRPAGQLPARHRCCPIVSKATRRILGQAKIAPSTIAPATKSLLPSSCCHRPRQSAHRPPKPPHRQIPIVVNRQPGGPPVPSWEAFGRRFSERANSYDGPASETLHHAHACLRQRGTRPRLPRRRTGERMKPAIYDAWEVRHGRDTKLVAARKRCFESISLRRRVVQTSFRLTGGAVLHSPVSAADLETDKPDLGSKP